MNDKIELLKVDVLQDLPTPAVQCSYDETVSTLNVYVGLKTNDKHRSLAISDTLVLDLDADNRLAYIEILSPKNSWKTDAKTAWQDVPQSGVCIFPNAQDGAVANLSEQYFINRAGDVLCIRIQGEVVRYVKAGDKLALGLDRNSMLSEILVNNGTGSD